MHYGNTILQVTYRCDTVMHMFVFQYFPMRNPIFSSSGCKRIAQKAELYLANVENPLHDPFAIAAGAEHDEL